MQYEDELAFDKHRRAYEISNGWDGWICRFRPPVTGYVHFYLHPLRQRPILFPGGISDIRDSPR